MSGKTAIGGITLVGQNSHLGDHACWAKQSLQNPYSVGYNFFMKKTTEKQIISLIKERPKESHKGDFGRIMIVAGSKGMAGAAILCGKAALKSGAGLVEYYAPEEIFTILQTAVPEATCKRRGTFPDTDRYDAVALGPGLGGSGQNRSLMLNLLDSYKGPLVIDADGINTIVSENLFDELIHSEADIVVTPHPGEAKRLLGIDIITKREETVLEIAKTFNVTAVLKGAGTLIALPEGKVFLNDTGNPGMATGGAGDVLTGIIAALMGQRLPAADAAAAGVYIHGLAGDMAAAEIGMTGMTAMDICDFTAKAFKSVLGK